MTAAAKPLPQQIGRPSPALLRGSLQDTGELKECSRCTRTCTPAGGVQVTPTSWICGACWTARSGRTKSRLCLLVSASTTRKANP